MIMATKMLIRITPIQGCYMDYKKSLHLFIDIITKLVFVILLSNSSMFKYVHHAQKDRVDNRHPTEIGLSIISSLLC